MKKAGLLFLAGVLCATALSARAENYFGEYDWLRFWHATPDWSDRYWTSWGNMGWLAARGDGSNTADRYYKLTWDEPMDLTGTRVSAFTQTSGGVNDIGTYKLQYSVDGLTQWEDIEVYNRTTGAPVTSLSGTTDYNLSFGNMPEGGVKGIRVLFPGGSYSMGTSGNGPGIYRLLPTGNVASGLGLDSSDPAFNILGTTFSDQFLGISPSVSMTSNRTPVIDQGSSASRLIDHNIDADGNGRVGWLLPVNGSEAIICDLGVSLTIHSVSLYSGTSPGCSYLAATMDVYVSDSADPAKWGQPVGLAKLVDGALTTLWDPDKQDIHAVGQYVILANPNVGNYHFLPHQLSINATAVVPEPATMTLLALGGLALLRRRRG